MLRGTSFIVVALGVSAATLAIAAPKPRPPARVGACALTRVTQVTQRLEDETNTVIAGSGSAVMLANGVYGVSYDQVRAVNRSRVGDRVRTCLVRLPTNCPKGDERGKWYKTTNLRTHESWTLPDAEHGCGGA